jgi:hypothetical protein
MPIRAEHDRSNDPRTVRAFLLLILSLPVAFVALTAVHPLQCQWNNEEWRLGGSDKAPPVAGIYHLTARDLNDGTPPLDDEIPVFWNHGWGSRSEPAAMACDEDSACSFGIETSSCAGSPGPAGAAVTITSTGPRSNEAAKGEAMILIRSH